MTLFSDDFSKWRNVKKNPKVFFYKSMFSKQKTKFWTPKLQCISYISFREKKKLILVLKWTLLSVHLYAYMFFTTFVFTYVKSWGATITSLLTSMVLGFPGFSSCILHIVCLGFTPVLLSASCRCNTSSFPSFPRPHSPLPTSLLTDGVAVPLAFQPVTFLKSGYRCDWSSVSENLMSFNSETIWLSLTSAWGFVVCCGASVVQVQIIRMLPYEYEYFLIGFIGFLNKKANSWDASIRK